MVDIPSVWHWELYLYNAFNWNWINQQKGNCKSSFCVSIFLSIRIYRVWRSWNQIGTVCKGRYWYCFQSAWTGSIRTRNALYICHSPCWIWILDIIQSDWVAWKLRYQPWNYHPTICRIAVFWRRQSRGTTHEIRRFGCCCSEKDCVWDGGTNGELEFYSNCRVKKATNLVCR
jgi:hypothetical protein